jgi:hypothetical protein
MPVTATIPPPAPTPSGTAWPRTGSTTLSGSDQRLNQPATTSLAGAPWYSQAMPSAGLQVEFTTHNGT